MITFWIGLAFLANSWLWGLAYFSEANPWLYVASVAAGVLLIAWSQLSASDASRDRNALLRRDGLVLVLLLLLAILVPWPYRLAPLLVLLGLCAPLWKPPCRWLAAFRDGAVISGIILLVQGLTLFGYRSWTARSRELPWPLPQLLSGVAQLLGIRTGTDGAHVVLPTMRENHPLATTWELFLDPASLAFIAGGLVCVALLYRRAAPVVTEDPVKNQKRSQKTQAGVATQQSKLSQFFRNPLVRTLGLLLLAAAVWLPFRAGLLMAVYLHRAIRTDYDSPLNLMNQFWSPWIYLLLLIPLALLLARSMPRLSVASLFSEPVAAPAPFLSRPVLYAAAGSFAIAVLFTLAACWDPIGKRKLGRMAFDEYHSKWEPTGRPFDTEWYGHLSGYNYACIYDFASRFYDVSRVTNMITDATLSGLDVLILKVPTEPIHPAETESVLRFVRNGGSLLMVGEHTDVFNTGYHLNTVARRLGFSFRYDCLFGTQSFFDQFYKPTFAPHPAVQYIRGLDFATSCSIDTGRSSGRGVIVSTGLKNSMADYHANNYYPPAVDHAAMQYGAFVQIWGQRHGGGRVLAFTDSTIFSNFSAFEPGKRELLMGMLEWLNHRDRIGNPRLALLFLGLALLLFGIARFRRFSPAPLVIIAAAALGWITTARALAITQEQRMPFPKVVRPYVEVAIDRTTCDGPLSKNGFINGSPEGFGIFERWILRLGYFTKRISDPDPLTANLLVFFYPTKPLSAGYQRDLLNYVEKGGKLLVIDSPKNTNSTATTLLKNFQLSMKPLPGQGTLSGPSEWPAVPIDAAYEISGGQPLFHLEGKPIGSIARHGKGSVVAIGFGSRFSDANMGVTGDVEPNEDLRKVFNLQFALMRAIVEDKLSAQKVAGSSSP